MRRRWKRRALWAALLVGAALVAIPATVAQASTALRTRLDRRNPMRKLVPLVVVIAVVLAVLGGTFASASGTQALAYVAVQNAKSEVLIDVGKKGDSPGDSVYFSENLLLNGNKVGRTAITCTFYSRSAGRCFGTLRLPGGTIEAGGSDLGGRSFAAAILGGTGRYAGASGVLRITELSDTRSRYEIQLEG